MSNIVFGKRGCLSKSKAKLASINAPLNVGDIVAPYKYYRNGKPIPPTKYDYTSGVTGLVVDEYLHPNYNQMVIKVAWISHQTIHWSGSQIYVKDASGSYLLKLS